MHHSNAAGDSRFRRGKACPPAHSPLPGVAARARPRPPLGKVKRAHRLWAAGRPRKRCRPLVAALPGRHFRRARRRRQKRPPLDPPPGLGSKDILEEALLLTSCCRLLTLPRTRDAKAAARGDELSGLSPERAEGSRSSSLPGLPHLKVNDYPAAAFLPAGSSPDPAAGNICPSLPPPFLFQDLYFSLPSHSHQND